MDLSTPRLVPAAAALAALLLAPSLHAGPDWEEAAYGTGDAGPLLPGAQVPKGKPPLSQLATISGGLGGFLTGPADVQDMYLIYIDDAKGFSAVANAPVAADGIGLDTQLWLFDFDGLGLLGNDGVGLSSGFGSSSDDSSGSSVRAEGMHYLAISVSNSDPLDAAGAPLFDQAVAGEVSGPDGTGGADPIAGWSSATGGGTYTIVLTGAAFIPCYGDVNGDGFNDIDDIVDVVLLFGTTDPDADLDEDGTVDIDDIVIAVLNFGKCNPVPPGPM